MFTHTSNDQNVFKAQDAGRILSTVEKRTSGFSMVNVAKCIIPSSSMRPRLKEGTSKICASGQNNALKTHPFQTRAKARVHLETHRCWFFETPAARCEAAARRKVKQSEISNQLAKKNLGSMLDPKWTWMSFYFMLVSWQPSVYLTKELMVNPLNTCMIQSWVNGWVFFGYYQVTLHHRSASKCAPAVTSLGDWSLDQNILPAST